VLSYKNENTYAFIHQLIYCSSYHWQI